MAGARRQRFLTREERELWAQVTRHDRPLARGLKDEGPANVAGVPSHEATETPEAINAAEPRHLSALPKKKLSSFAPWKKAAGAPEAPFDPRTGRLLARGRRQIEARLDLHGLRQPDAHAALRQFLSRCREAGHRHVLIITGKGGDGDGQEGVDFWRGERRGILRRLVPQWLSEPEFRVLIVSFRESAPRHGGTGALYVTIRRRSWPIAASALGGK